MKRKKGVHYFENEWKRMKAHLKSYLKKREQEDLHRFRVQVKKLGAFFILSDRLSPHPHMNKKFKPVKKIFKRAGELRNTFIQLKLTNRSKTNKRIYPDLQTEKAVRKFRENSGKYLKKIKNAHRKLKRNIRSIKQIAVYRFYQNQVREIAGLLSPLQFNEKLHECRKRIKVLLYNYQPVLATPGIVLNEDYLDRLQEAIGNWHDYQLSIPPLPGGHTAGETTADVVNELQLTLKENIIDLSQDFYHRATTAAV
ncbi:CHAD domain-containing protein [Mucilaginibacter sp. OK268]|uniref:CHAD domain-containing protein n=1 Tax=Mucilaginibacter sp. OK268 TaxID=1881048 RepID=UPI00088E4B2E|nr:CHAD domain-containing protein [Mucilaginibacter sp. OK268]SDP96982.1 CHAD domain-containing protein [Mucilaginibacter sp. OK268]